jgi:hypothetical protein
LRSQVAMRRRLVLTVLALNYYRCCIIHRNASGHAEEECVAHARSTINLGVRRP